MDTMTIEFDGESLEFKLDHDARTWLPAETHGEMLLGEGAFPLIAVSHGRRYELYSDGSFAEVER